MPILLPEDRAIQLPKMHRVRQRFDTLSPIDIAQTVRSQGQRQEIASGVRAGQKVAVAVGSRGIRNLSLIVRNTVDWLKSRGAEPFVVSAMGSHGGGTDDGQRAILEGYGITEESMGVPVHCRSEVVQLGVTSQGIPIYIDSLAAQADLIIPVNRVKVHTDFVSDIQSGLCKMLVIGLGHHKGCSAVHEAEFTIYGDVLKEGAQLIMDKVEVPFGVAVVENAHDETCLLEFVPGKRLIEREKEILQLALRNMPKVLIPEIDILVVQEIGKNISGNGFDPNIIGKSYPADQLLLSGPKIHRMVLLDVTPESHGNAIGMGLFDVITRNVFDQLDLEAIYANGIAAKEIDSSKIPLIAADEREAVIVAYKVMFNTRVDELRIVKIKNTLELQEIEVSDALLPFVAGHPQLELMQG